MCSEALIMSSVFLDLALKFFVFILLGLVAFGEQAIELFLVMTRPFILLV